MSKEEVAKLNRIKESFSVVLSYAGLGSPSYMAAKKGIREVEELLVNEK